VVRQKERRGRIVNTTVFCGEARLFVYGGGGFRRRESREAKPAGIGIQVDVKRVGKRGREVEKEKEEAREGWDDGDWTRERFRGCNSVTSREGAGATHLRKKERGGPIWSVLLAFQKLSGAGPAASGSVVGRLPVSGIIP
jgi:hypothetical protein